jgi:hypothetical protein
LFRLLLFRLLTADLDAYSRHLNVHARSRRWMIPIAVIVIADDDIGIGMVHAFGNACSIVADLLADLLGIGGMREREPQSRRGNANQEFAHG